MIKWGIAKVREGIRLVIGEVMGDDEVRDW